MIVDVSTPTQRGLLERATERFRDTAGVEAYLASGLDLAFVHVADDDASHVRGWCWGYVLPRPDGTSMAYLHEIEVDGDHRRQGAGTALVTAFLDAARQAAASKTFLTTGEQNHAAKALYERLGFARAEQGPTVNFWISLEAPAQTSADSDADQGRPGSSS